MFVSIVSIAQLVASPSHMLTHIFAHAAIHINDSVCLDNHVFQDFLTKFPPLPVEKSRFREWRLCVCMCVMSGLAGLRSFRFYSQLANQTETPLYSTLNKAADVFQK